MALSHVICFLLMLNYVVLQVKENEEDIIIADQLVSNYSILKLMIASVNNSTLSTMKQLESKLKTATDFVIKQNQKDIELQFVTLKSNLTILGTSSSKSIIDQCVQESQSLDIMVESISDEVKQCITVTLAENVNIITGCIVEAQTFMVFPQKIAANLQTCGTSQQCLLLISADAVNESLEIPSKVLMLTARIQQLAFRSLFSVNRCALNGLINVLKQGTSILEDISFCVSQKLMK